MASRVEISKRLVLINSASSLAVMVLNLSVLVWLQQYLLKRVTPEEYSLLPVLYSVMMFAPLVRTILTGGLGRYIVEAYAKDDDERVTRIVSTMFPILCGAGLLFLTGGWVFAWHIHKALNIAPERVWDARIMMAMLVFSAGVNLPAAPFCAGFFVRQRFVLQNLVRIGTEFFRLALLFTLLFGVSTRVVWIVTASVAAGLLNLLISLVISRRLVPALRFRPSRIRWGIAREIMGFGGWHFVGSCANAIRTSADAVILNVLATPVDVTCFHVGSMALRHIQQTSGRARSSLSPVLTAMHATGARDRLRNVYLRGGRLGLWGLLSVVLPLIIYSQEIIALYIGEAYRESATVMALLLTGPLISYGSIMLPQVAQATAQVRRNSIRVALTHAVNLFLTLYLVGVLKMGAKGSALATFIVVAISQPILMWPLGLRLVGATWKEWLRETIVPGMLPGLMAAVLWTVLKLAARPETLAALVACVLCGEILYMLMLMCFGLRPKDREQLAGVSGRCRQYLVRLAGDAGEAIPSCKHEPEPECGRRVE